MTISIETIHAAQDRDIAATAEVTRATEDRILPLAAKAARRVAGSGPRVADLTDEFSQIGRIAAWEALGRFTGASADDFMGFIHVTVERALMDATREARNPGTGADDDALKIFSQMMALTDDDPYLAERLSQTVPPKGRRLGADRAYAARIAWQGTLSFDAPLPGGDSSVPLREILADEYGMPVELITESDITAEQRRVKHAVVNSILDVMGPGQRNVLKCSFGIGDAPYFGCGREDNRDAEMAEHLGLASAKHVSGNRTVGLKTFAKRFITATATCEAEADALRAAAARNLTRSAA